MFSSRLVSTLCSRNFSSSPFFKNRFSRDHLRNRLQKQELKDLTKQKKVEVPYRTDEIRVRPVSHLWRALGFTAFTGAATFTIAIVRDCELIKQSAQKSLSEMFFEKQLGFKKLHQPNGDTISWSSLTGGEKQTIILIAANVLVYAMWKIRPIQPFMWRYFSNSYASKSLCLPMALSMFSHMSFIHLALNMYVANSFSGMVIDKFLGPEQFWAFYVTGGVVSSLLSLAHKAMIRSNVRAVGASGAILAVLAYTCMSIPDAKLSLIFVPGFTFSAESALYGILLFDLAGLVLGFRLFDHAAHLGGTLFGMFYSLYLQDLIWERYGGFIEKKFYSKDQ